MLSVFWASLKTQKAYGGNCPTNCFGVFGGSKNTEGIWGRNPPGLSLCFWEFKKNTRRPGGHKRQIPGERAKVDEVWDWRLS